LIEATNFTTPQMRKQADLPSAWWAVVSRFLLHGLITSTWVSRIAAIQAALGLTNAHLGLCLLGTAVGSVLAIPLAGWLVTRYGSRQVTAWSTLGFSLALVAPSLAVNAGTLFIALILFGAMAGANDVTINAQAVAIEKAAASPTMSRFHAMFSIGGMIGASLGGLVAARGIAPQLHLTAASALFLVLSLVTAPLLFEAHDNRRESSQVLRPSRIPLVLIMLAAIGFCMFLSEGAIADWTGVYLKQDLSANGGVAAAGYAVFSTGMALFRLLGDAIAARLGPVRTVRAGALMAAAGLTFALTAHSALSALPGFALTGAGFSVIVPLVFGAGGRVDSVGSGAGVATVSGSGYIGFLFGPPFIGLIAQQTSLRIALLVVVALSLVAAAMASAVRETSATQEVTH
jgi:MFS family permease